MDEWVEIEVVVAGSDEGGRLLDEPDERADECEN